MIFFVAERDYTSEQREKNGKLNNFRDTGTTLLLFCLHSYDNVSRAELNRIIEINWQQHLLGSKNAFFFGLTSRLGVDPATYDRARPTIYRLAKIFQRLPKGDGHSGKAKLFRQAFCWRSISAFDSA